MREMIRMTARTVMKASGTGRRWLESEGVLTRTLEPRRKAKLLERVSPSPNLIGPVHRRGRSRRERVQA
jgi:hypothetical protein